MVFNWFRRQFNAKKKAEDSPVEQETIVPEKQESESTPQTEEPSTDPSADYLKWAKAAYENIQKQQAAESQVAIAPETSDLSEATQTETAVAIAPSIETPDLSATTATEEVDSTESSEQILQQTEAIAGATETPSVAETSNLSVTTAIETLDTEGRSEQKAIATTPEIAAEQPSLSFLARAKAERQTRLEEIKEKATVEPEPETPTPVKNPVTVSERVGTPGQTIEEAELTLDEGFLWSAEILAAQGRRPEEVSIEEITWLKQLRQGLGKTRRGLINQLKAIVGQGPLNQDALMEIEALLLQADVGVEATDRIIENLQNKLTEEALPPAAAIAYLKQLLRDILDRPSGKTYNPTFTPEKDTLNIWLITGVNGAGKTTTIGKIAHLAQKSDYRCLIAAADTFRAAAVEQVKVWGDRSNTEVVSNPGKNTDPAAVVFDAIAAARARGTELLLVDTAGRLQNKKNLMAELSKIRRIIDKKAPEATVESLLVLDATLGQNGLRQAEVFCEVAKLSGVVLTKLDGTAKGGVALAVAEQMGLPIRFIGAGEGIEDLRPFSSYEFVEALISG